MSCALVCIFKYSILWIFFFLSEVQVAVDWCSSKGHNFGFRCEHNYHMEPFGKY